MRKFKHNTPTEGSKGINPSYQSGKGSAQSSKSIKKVPSIKGGIYKGILN